MRANPSWKPAKEVGHFATHHLETGFHDGPPRFVGYPGLLQSASFRSPEAGPEDQKHY